MARAKRLYRAIAHYPDWTATRHFQSRRARADWVANRLAGYPEQPGIQWDDEGRAPIPPAIRVEIADSEPIVFPGDDNG